MMPCPDVDDAMPSKGPARQAALSLSDEDEEEVAADGAEISYGLLRNRRDSASAQAANRKVSLSVKACSQWPQTERAYPNPNHPRQQGGKTCKPGQC